MTRKLMILLTACYANAMLAQTDGYSIGWPEEGFCSPGSTGCVVPVGVPAGCYVVCADQQVLKIIR